MTKPIAIQWPDGSVLDAHSWTGLLLKTSKRRFVRGYDIRKDLAKRAFVWSGATVDVDLPTPDFFRALEAAKLLKVLRPI